MKQEKYMKCNDIINEGTIKNKGCKNKHINFSNDIISFFLQRKLKLPSCPLVLIFFGDDNRKIESKNKVINIVIDEEGWDGRGFESKVEHKGSMYRGISTPSSL